jgi:phosphoserine phosphatase
MPVAVIDEVIAQRITPTPGARTLIATMRANGAYTCLVSGGFTLFTGRVAAMLGFDEARANTLEVAGERLTGAVVEPVFGREGKRDALLALRAQQGLSMEETLVAGDGANDMDMIAAAGLGVAFHAKPAVAAVAPARIDHADLTALLYVQGYRRDEFVVA